MKLLSCFLFAVASAGFLNADQKITITGNDSMQFDVKEFTVQAGKKVELGLSVGNFQIERSV